MGKRGWSRQSDEKLLTAASQEAAAFAAFYDRHLSAVVAYFRGRVREPEVAFDLTAETFARVLQSAASFDPERGSAMGWLFAIARNLLYDAAKHRRVSDHARTSLALDTVALWDEDLDRVERLADDGLARARRALDRLKPDQRDAVWARVVLEQDYNAIAQELSCSPSVARQRVSRGLRALQAELSEETQ